MNFFKILFAVFLISIQLAHGRLGETLDECKTRYGDVVRTMDSGRADFPTYVFQKGNVIIGVRFLKGHSGQESFVAADNTHLSENQIDEILTANSAGSHWSIDSKTGIPGAPSFESRVYSRSDKEARARFDKTVRDEILTVEMLDFVAAFAKPASGF